MIALLLWAGIAGAGEGGEPLGDVPAERSPPVDGAPAVDETPAMRWSGYGLPLVGANTTDGFGLGLGGELFGRPPGDEHGYVYKLTVSTWYTWPLNYTSHYVQLEHRGEAHHLLRAGFQAWKNLLYAGSGGGDVLVDWGEQELHNRILSPYVLVAIARPIPGSAWRAYGQLYGRWAGVEPGERSLLEARAPLGLGGAAYADGTVGVEIEAFDRWPMPIEGLRAEADVVLGATLADRRLRPLVAVHGEIVGWVPLAGERLVLGGRLLAAKAFGPRPFFEQVLTHGRWRDEIGLDQALSGYGRTRTRGDGVLAALVEARPLIGRTRHPFWDFGFFASLYAEEAFLFDGARLGPHMPSVGGGPVILFQGASQLRPFLAWGWRAEEPGAKRLPQMQFGLSLSDPL